MANYDFLNLSPFDFENLSRDLLQAELKITLESFTTATDGGIDFRYSKGNKNDIIVQCKRYSTFPSLFANLKKEVLKLDRLKPKRYIITTSVGLTPNQKDKVQQLCKDYILNRSDIYGKDDLNNLLQKFPSIEKDNFKLWLSSTTVLDQILHGATYNQSEMELDKIKKEIKFYVPNKSFNDALTILEKNHYVIISGIPGIGKTTLARMLCYKFLGEQKSNFDEFVVISGDISEGAELFKPDKKQIFLYDDFLGTNFLEVKFRKNEETRIQRFIEKIQYSKNKILICTTREYILRQAQLDYAIDEDKINMGKCIIDLEDYNKFEKAKILYNHLYFSPLKKNILNNIITEKRYLRIIYHPNYNPRIISEVATRFLKMDEKNLYDVIINFLDNPQNIWKLAYESHIREISRCILAILALHKPPIFLNDLEESVESFSNLHGQAYGFRFNIFTYNTALKELEDTFITLYKDDKGQDIVDFQNPSIRDFLMNYLDINQMLLQDCIDSSVYFEQLLSTFVYIQDPSKVPYAIVKSWSYDKKIKINKNIENIIKVKLIRDFDNLKFSTIYNYTDWGEKIHYMDYGSLSIYKKLTKICHLYANDLSSDIEDLVIKRIKESYPEDFDNTQLRYILNLIDKLKNRFPIDIEELVKLIHDNSYDDDIEEITNIADFEKEIQEILLITIPKDKQFQDKIYDTVKGYMWASNFDSIDETFEHLCDINDHYKLGLTRKLQNLREEIEEKESERKMEQPTKIKLEDKDYSSDDFICNMFDSLLEKE